MPRHDDEDEILFPELVDRVSQQAVEDEYAEDPSSMLDLMTLMMKRGRRTSTP